ncbi:MAG: AI-2E family transporter [Methylophilaceae bacterium]|nr:AI-2E family transporter [Methyloradius sp.]
MTAKRENVLPDYRIILLVALALFIAYRLLPIISPFLIAAIFAYICNPLVDRISGLKLGKLTIGRTVATMLVMLLLLTGLIGVILVIVPMLQKELFLVIQKLPNYINTLRTQLDPWLFQHFGIGLEIDSGKVQEVFTKNWKSATDYASRALVIISTHGLAFIGWMVNLMLIPVVLFYLLRDWHQLIERIAVLLPRRHLAKTLEISMEIDAVLAEFLRGQLSVMILMGIFYAAGLGFAGLELAIPIGLIAGLLGFVPYLGPTTGILLAMLAAILQFNNLGDLVPVAAVFAVGQAIESMLLTPWLVGDRIGLHPVVVIFALLAGGELFGFSGILLALPVGAAIAVLVRHAKRHYVASNAYLKD